MWGSVICLGMDGIGWWLLQRFCAKGEGVWVLGGVFSICGHGNGADLPVPLEGTRYICGKHIGED